jgi:hypothetical protein
VQASVRDDDATGAAAITVEGGAAGALAELLAAPLVSSAQIRRTLHAHRLAGAESFTELMSLARLVGVEQHAYQMETTRRVVRTLRGRALLADEVGLGKTIVVGNVADDGDLEARLLAQCASAATEAELTTGLDWLADELLRARGRYDDVRALDQALFGEEFEA